VLIYVIAGRMVRRIPIVRDNRIINGVDAEPGEYPSQVSTDFLVAELEDES
jgi:secreted trypsin-like serine protease